LSPVDSLFDMRACRW